MSRKLMDMSAENELGKFLDCYFYPCLKKDFNIGTYRVEDINYKFIGVDVCLHINNVEYYLDEKTQLYYINKNLPTFDFEIDFINTSNQLSQGWLFNKELITNYYLLVWSYATTNKLSEIKSTDFSQVECLIIDRNKVINYLASNGWDYDNISNKAFYIRMENIIGKISTPNENNFYFYHSNPNNYSEQPINIVIRKNILLELAEVAYVVSRTNVIRIK
ncbi:MULTISPECIES: hypothetical protein [Clostridium]|uniref:hypothetical protein n=1 Tax=Clostridium TaxID=1485 RepID=UPI0004D60351|nr:MULTISPECIES: hypothetical protein [Clostridium]KEH85269.1 hypothetical protein Z967_09085 [Clostridium novyi A str. 4540]KEH92319.1 hypothetical protein Z963_06300 [Clostridium botulinum C/D str. It1]